jgi:hypothetical protein
VAKREILFVRRCAGDGRRRVLARAEGEDARLLEIAVK